MDTNKNLTALVSTLSSGECRAIFQALCTETDRLDRLNYPHDANKVRAIRDAWAARMAADECCGRVIPTHAYCND